MAALEVLVSEFCSDFSTTTKTRMATSISSEVQDIRRNWTFVVQLVIWNPQVKEEKILKSVHKQGNA